MISWTDVLIAGRWYCVVFVLGLVGWAVFFDYLKSFPSKGYLLGRAAGLILVSSISWMLSVLNILNFSVNTVLLIVLILAFLGRKNWREVFNTIKDNWREVLLAELVCIVLFMVGIIFRSQKPAISDIEKYMDMALLNAVLRTSSGVPIDPWYAGSTLNYYYFGHWMVAVIAKLSGTISSYAFNLGTATTIMMAGGNIFLIAQAVTKKFSAAIFSVFLALFASNFHPFIAWLRETPNYFFFNSGRFIEQVINEYPLYSFILGDLHAHMLSLILTTSCILAGYIFLSSSKEKFWSSWPMGFLIGLMFATNAFDIINFAIYTFILLSIYFLRNKSSFHEIVKVGFVMAVSAFIPFMIFKISFVSPSGGLGFAFFKTPLSHILLQFGVFLSIIFVSLVVGLSTYIKKISVLKKKDNRNIFSSVLQHFFVSSNESIFVWVICLTGLALVVLPEFIFLKDIYFIQNPPFYRANTVFKIWYQAWVFMAIGSGILGYYLLVWLKEKYKSTGKFLGFVFLFIMVMISLFGFKVGWKTLSDYKPNTLDGLDYIRNIEDGPQDYEAIVWARENIKGQPIVLEATGQSYSTYNWFSAFTGLPTIIGWQSHEWGWRYEKDGWNKIALRMGQVESVYKAQDEKVLMGLVQNMKISYVLFGLNEAILYNVDDSLLKKVFGDPVFDSSKSKIYKTGY